MITKNDIRKLGEEVRNMGKRCDDKKLTLLLDIANEIKKTLDKYPDQDILKIKHISLILNIKL